MPRGESSRLELGSPQAEAEVQGRGGREEGGCHVPREVRSQTGMPKPISRQPQHHALQQLPKLLALAPGQHGRLSPASALVSPLSLVQQEEWLLPQHSSTPPVLSVSQDKVLVWLPRPHCTPWVLLSTPLCPQAGPARSQSLLWGWEPELEPLLAIARPRIWKNPATSPLRWRWGSSDPASDRWDTGTGFCNTKNQRCARWFKMGFRKNGAGAIRVTGRANAGDSLLGCDVRGEGNEKRAVAAPCPAPSCCEGMALSQPPRRIAHACVSQLGAHERQLLLLCRV